jgi:L-alanine-DL-glutamate epimerase-like enolase superfamily enzyme
MVLEFQGGDIDWRDAIFGEPVPLRNGYLEVPSKPGLGVELNREELAKHLV